MELRISEQALPGIGMRYELEVADGQRLYVIAYRDGRREIGVRDRTDEPEAQVILEPQAAMAVAALLLGARFTVDSLVDGEDDTDEVVVDVIELRHDSAAVGRSQAELGVDDPDAVVLAVMSDTTPELVESETGHYCQEGDRIVVAARAGRISQVWARLQRPGSDLS